MTRALVYSIGLIISAIAMFIWDPGSVIFTVSSGLAIGFAVPLLDTLLLHAPFLKIVWYSLRAWRSRVRISVSYLYRIRVDNEYLLVKGKRFDQFQPVGGVYKFHPTSSGERIRMQVLDDDLLVPDEVSEGDLRVRVPGKKLLSFVRWFESGRGRETDAWREFYEELIGTAILPESAFPFVNFDRIERLYRPMRYSRWAKSQELLIADIVELLPTPVQLEELRKLKLGGDSRVFWASEDQIRRLGAEYGAASQPIRIAETAIWTIDASI